MHAVTCRSVAGDRSLTFANRNLSNFRSFYSRSGKSYKRTPEKERTFTFRVSRRRREMYSGHGRLCLYHVCLSLVAFPHYCTDPDVTWGNDIGVPSNCALLGGFAICAWGLADISPNAKCQRVLLFALCLVFLVKQ